jgi:hypothetical protein
MIPGRACASRTAVVKSSFELRTSKHGVASLKQSEHIPVDYQRKESCDSLTEQSNWQRAQRYTALADSQLFARRWLERSSIRDSMSL